jgi:hypothetical protein
MKNCYNAVDGTFYDAIIVDDLAKSHQVDGKEKSSRCKACTFSQAARRNLEE